MVLYGSETYQHIPAQIAPIYFVFLSIIIASECIIHSSYHQSLFPFSSSQYWVFYSAILVLQEPNFGSGNSPETFQHSRSILRFRYYTVLTNFHESYQPQTSAETFTSSTGPKLWQKLSQNVTWLPRSLGLVLSSRSPPQIPPKDYGCGFPGLGFIITGVTPRHLINGPDCSIYIRCRRCLFRLQCRSQRHVDLGWCREHGCRDVCFLQRRPPPFLKSLTSLSACLLSVVLSVFFQIFIHYISHRGSTKTTCNTPLDTTRG